MSFASPPILQITGLHVRRDGHPILSDLHWAVGQGEHWVLLGPNGSGKSSLLSVLGGYLFSTSGSIEVLGNRFGQSDWRTLRAHLGIVSGSLASMVPPEEPAAFTVLTGRDGGIGLWAEVSEAELALATSCLATVEAESLALREWRHLSQGEKQRVLIARALVREPKLLILDEPCAGLDPAARERLLRFIERLTQRSDAPSVLLVTHHVEEIAKGFTHLLLLQRGRVAARGPIQTTLTKDALSELYEIPLHLSHRNGRYQMEFTAESEKDRN